MTCWILEQVCLSDLIYGLCFPLLAGLYDLHTERQLLSALHADTFKVFLKYVTK